MLFEIFGVHFTCMEKYSINMRKTGKSAPAKINRFHQTAIESEYSIHLIIPHEKFRNLPFREAEKVDVGGTSCGPPP